MGGHDDGNSLNESAPDDKFFESLAEPPAGAGAGSDPGIYIGDDDDDEDDTAADT